MTRAKRAMRTNMPYFICKYCHVLECSSADNKTILDLLVQRQVLEALLLHTGAVDDVGRGNDLGSKLVGLDTDLTTALKGTADLLRKLDLLGCDKVDCAVVVLQQLAKRVHSAAVLEITNEGDGEAVGSTNLLTNGEEIEEGLSRVLARAVTGVDDRVVSSVSSNLGAVILRVAEDDSVSVLVKSADGVRQGLALLCAREDEVRDVKNAISLHTKTHLRGDSHEKMQLLSGELVDRGDVSTLEGEVEGSSAKSRAMASIRIFAFLTLVTRGVWLMYKSIKLLARANTVLLEEVGSTGSGVQVVAKLVELLDRRQQLLLVLVSSDRQEDVLLGKTEASGDEGLHISLVLGTTKASNLTIWGHGGRGVLLEGEASHSLGGQLDQVNTSDLGNEGERSRGSDVALNDLDIVVLGDELNVVRTGDVESLTNLLSSLFNTPDGLGIQVLRGLDQGSVTRVNTSVLNVLRDEVTDHDTSAAWLRVGDSVAELLSFIDAGKLLPLRLVDTDSVKHTRELVSVLSGIDHLRGGTKNLDVETVERQGDVVGGLTTHGENDTAGVLELVDIEDSLEGDVLEVQAVGLVVISRDSLRVVVDHNSFEIVLTKSADSADGAPIELDGGTDTYGQLACFVEGNIKGSMSLSDALKFTRDGVNLLDDGHDIVVKSVLANGLLLLGLSEERRGNIADLLGAHQLAKLAQSLELAQEPLVNLGQLPDLVDGVARVHGISDGKHSLVRRSLQLLVDRHESVGLLEAEVANIDSTDSLLNGFFECSSNAHDFTNTLHGGAEESGDASELFQIPTRNLDDNVVEGRLEAGAGNLGDSVLDLVQRDTETKLGSDESQGSVLDVALTDNAEVTDDVDSSASQHHEVLVGQSLRRGNDDRVTSVNAQRIEVLHVTDSNAVVLAIADDFVLDLLPALHTALDEYLGTGSESLVAELAKLLLVIGETTAQTTESVCGTNDQGEADLLTGGHSLLHVVGRGRVVMTVLSTESTVDTVRLLLLDDLANKVGVDREEVDLVGQTLGSLDGGDIGVDQDCVDALLLKSLDGLRTRVIELTGLTDGETTTTKNQNLLDGDSGVGLLVLSKITTRELDGLVHHARVLNDLLDSIQEDVEEELGVLGTRGTFGVELDTEVGAVDVSDTLVGAVVGVDEEFGPVLGEGARVDSVTVVLRCDVTLARNQVCGRDVVASVTVLHLDRLGTGGAGEQLVSQTDTEDGNSGLADVGLNVLDSLLHQCRVTRTVGDEETIVLLASQGREVVVPGDDLDLYTTLDEASKLVVLETDVNADNADGFWLLGLDHSISSNSGFSSYSPLLGVMPLVMGAAAVGPDFCSLMRPSMLPFSRMIFRWPGSVSMLRRSKKQRSDRQCGSGMPRIADQRVADHTSREDQLAGDTLLSTKGFALGETDTLGAFSCLEGDELISKVNWTIEKLSPGSWRAKAVCPRADERRPRRTLLSCELRNLHHLDELRVKCSATVVSADVALVTRSSRGLRPAYSVQKVSTPKWSPSQAVGTKRFLLLSAMLCVCLPAHGFGSCGHAGREAG
ncbi:carbamoyl-phosphate synth, partial [Aureobasidium sp. EXF-3399]